SRPGALVNDDLLAKCLGELVGDDPRDDASATARWKGIDNRNWPDRIGLRPSKARQDRERGSARCQMQKLSAGKFHLNLPLASDHSITSSARASSVGGTSRPSAFAVLRLIKNSNFVVWNTGKSAGFAPLRM